MTSDTLVYSCALCHYIFDPLYPTPHPFPLVTANHSVLSMSSLLFILYPMRLKSHDVLEAMFVVINKNRKQLKCAAIKKEVDPFLDLLDNLEVCSVTSGHPKEITRGKDGKSQNYVHSILPFGLKKIP